MVRTNHPLVERMALIWHDWFATADVDSQQLSIQQAQLFERRWMGPFSDLLLDVTVDPAMLIWLSGLENTKRAPNENYAREMMELFTLGASDASGFPYSEDDVREQARALTGWTADWEDDVGYVNFHFDAKRHDAGSKTIFGQTGNFDWTDSCRLCLAHSAHKTFFVNKLWSYFIPRPAVGEDAQGAGAALRRARATRCGRWSRRSSCTRPSTAARRWSSRRSSTSPGCCAPAAAAFSSDWSWIAEHRRPAPLPPAQRLRLERRPLARHLDLPRPLDRRQRDRRLRRDRRRGRLRRRRGPEAGGAARRCSSGATRWSATRPARASSATRARSAPRRPPIGSRRPSACCARTPCGS